MTFEQFFEAQDTINEIYRLKAALRCCMNSISEGDNKLYIMGSDLPVDISKHLTERAAEMLKEKISALEKKLNEL